jgi:uncharacterized protein (DUF924 family)
MTDQPGPAEVLLFWFGPPAERGKAHKRWFVKDPALDAGIRERFLALYDEARGGRHAHWQVQPGDCLALVIVLDQFPRNMFRGTARAFESDPLALEAARHALERGFDRGMLAVERLFLYLPFEHSEALADQERACALMKPLDALQPELDAYRYAVLHREVVARFGRFPHRNAVLGRGSTPEELEFLKGPGSSF